MNKKLKIYSTLFVVVLIVFVVPSAFHFKKTLSISEPGEKLEFVENPNGFAMDTVVSSRKTRDGKVIMVYKSKGRHVRAMSYTVFVEPKPLSGRKELISSSFGQTYKVDMEKVRLTIPESQTRWINFPMIFAIISVIANTVLFIWLFYMVYKLIRSIRRGEIFVTEVAKYLETTGMLMAALYLYDLLASFIIYHVCFKHIHLADYNVVFHNDSNVMYIVTGMALMIISQIILMGKELKEEQDLTI